MLENKIIYIIHYSISSLIDKGLYDADIVIF